LEEDPDIRRYCGDEDVMSNVIQLSKLKPVQDDLLLRVDSFRLKIILNGLSEESSTNAALIDMQRFAAEVVDRVVQITRHFNAVDSLIESVESTEIQLSLKRQLRLNREAIVLAMLGLAQEFKLLKGKML
jgi:hypothetical protein